MCHWEEKYTLFVDGTSEGIKKGEKFKRRKSVEKAQSPP